MKRVDLIKEIAAEFELIANRLSETEVATVASMVELEPQHLAEIAKRAQKLTGSKNVKLKTVIDKLLLAGIIIRYGNSGSKLSLITLRLLNVIPPPPESSRRLLQTADESSSLGSPERDHRREMPPLRCRGEDEEERSQHLVFSVLEQNIDNLNLEENESPAATRLREGKKKSLENGDQRVYWRMEINELKLREIQIVYVLA
ncbi:hypothetical protein SASPL_150626 [Salvia splendens]|uniref:Uncharacterized protein n=1 Tax=Salvia splendens TaxID=180675 RepID=A0A8X8W6F0_SALSN|nr:hypothetical protein SASPL_150626 [Salvia splendens]